MMSRIRILGVGSPHEEDNLGWLAVHALEHMQLADIFSSDIIEFQYLNRPGPLLLNAFDGADRVVIIDAMRSGSPPGTVRKLDESEIETLLAPVSSHGFDLATSLALARSTGFHNCEVIVLGIETDMILNDTWADNKQGIQDTLLELIAQEISQSDACNNFRVTVK